MRFLRWLLAAAGTSLIFAFLPAAALGDSSPSIESTVAYGVTQTDATLEAKINPESLGMEGGAYYQFQVVANPSEYQPEIVCPVKEIWPLGLDGCIGTHGEALPIGFIGRGTWGSYVRLDLASAGMTLTPGTTYHYRVLAARAKQTEDTLEWEAPAVVGPDQTFTTLTPGTPPGIEDETATNIASTDATLEAKIDPEGLETTYEIYLEAPSCANDKRILACEADGGVPIAKGTVPADSAGQTVSVDVAAAGHILTPDTIEGYRVLASNSAGTRYGGEKTFVTLPGAPPVIESVTLSHLTSTDATLEAKIDTEGQATDYQFSLWSSCAHEACEYIRNIPLPHGRLLGSFVGQSVSLDLNSVGVTLNKGAEYGWGVSATNEDEQSANANGSVFEPPEPLFEPLGSKGSPGSGGNQPPASGNEPPASGGGEQPAGSGTPSSPVPELSSPLGGSSKAGAAKGKAGKHKRHGRHGKKPSRHRVKVAKHNHRKG